MVFLSSNSTGIDLCRFSIKHTDNDSSLLLERSLLRLFLKKYYSIFFIHDNSFVQIESDDSSFTIHNNITTNAGL